MPGGGASAMPCCLGEALTRHAFAPSCAPSELQLQHSSMFEPNPFPNIPAIERSPPADAKVRRIKAQLAPRMVTIGKQRKLADVMGIMSDATVGTPPPSVPVCHT